jgi:hypothetical protein
MGTAQNIEATEITAKTLTGEILIDYLILPDETAKHKKLFASDKKRLDAGINLPIRRHLISIIIGTIAPRVILKVFPISDAISHTFFILPSLRKDLEPRLRFPSATV